MRESYERGGLDEGDLAGTWLEQFERWLQDAVDAGLPEPNAMVVATAGVDGAPTTRTVLLKDLDERGLTFFTNRASRKGRQAAANPRAAITFPWHALQRQVAVTGRIEPIAEAESDAYFHARPRGSQLGAVASPQSSVVPDRQALARALEEAGARFPESTRIERPASWGGLRVVPETVEFWQGRPNRLHDRLRFARTGEGWVVERLAP